MAKVLTAGLAAVVIASFFSGEADAWIYVNTNTGDGSCIVTLTGEMTLTDANFFEVLTEGCKGGGVLLESKGGRLETGLRIGKLVKERRMETAVAYDAMCASACALAWLGGVKRNIFETSLIGFHAAYVLDGSQPKESGVANALVGSYMTLLGLPTSAIIFATSADPKSMNWLNFRDVNNLGIEINLLSETDYGWIDQIRQDDPHYSDERARQ